MKQGLSRKEQIHRKKGFRVYENTPVVIRSAAFRRLILEHPVASGFCPLMLSQ